MPVEQKLGERKEMLDFIEPADWDTKEIALKGTYEKRSFRGRVLKG